MRVHNALNKWKRREFNYGDADCCQFAAFIVKELTGKDYSERFKYDSEAQAEVLVGREGELVDFIGSILGDVSSDIKDGDPCIVDIPMIGQVCGIKLSDRVVCLTQKGMVQIPDRYLIAGWSV
jgi:uncharacterized protein YuzE